MSLRKLIYITMCALISLPMLPAHDALAAFCINNFPYRVYQPLPEALDALVTDDEVTVTQVMVGEWAAPYNYYYSFEPKDVTPSIGFIIYPGACVDPGAYAPFAHEFARQGFSSFIVRMTDDLAIGGTVQRATRVISDHPGIQKWAIGGHSMGAFGACAYAREHSNIIDGAVLWAGYPAEIARLDDRIIKAESIYGTYDGICTLDEIELSRQHLPPYTQFTAIAGGNHTQFGWYDTSPDPVQSGDNTAGITRQEQQSQIVQATADFLNVFNRCPGDPDNDYDNDTVCGDVDNCPFIANANQADADSDEVGNVCDNCADAYNPFQVDCDDDGGGDICDPDTIDTYPPLGNGCSNACECEGNFNVDVDVDGGDAAIFKADFGRSGLDRPCTNGDPCKGDFTCDGNVSGTDVALFKSDFGRNSLNNPCPACATDPWCTYP